MDQSGYNKLPVMAGKEPYHAIKLDPEKCFGCTLCMKICPTEAIRIRNGLPEIDSDWCIDCGNCLRACPANAYYVEQDDLSVIHNFKYRVALFPSVMIGQFPERFSEGQIYEALAKIGFTHVYEVEQPIGVLLEEIKKYSHKTTEPKPLISSFCPAVIRLIQVKYPSLAENIVRLKPPHDLAAYYAIENLKKQGIRREEIGIFYITPCAAKMAAVKRPMGEKESIVDGIVNMSDIYNRVMKVIYTPGSVGIGRDQLLSREGILWCLTDGEAGCMNNRAIAVDGIHNVVGILDHVENDKLPDLDFLELRSCDESCAGGILLTGNRFLTVERLKQRALHYPVALLPDTDCADVSFLSNCLKSEQVEGGQAKRFGHDRARALEKMKRAQKIVCQLPGIDCGACGAPNCHALADDIANHKTKMSDCVFLQQRWEAIGKINPAKAFGNMEKKWGKGRFEADCNKKGTRNEGY
jgi:Na+-translocating ferredoxin:NAD+ oxidoreductase RNF subunit RnfB